MVQKLHQVIDPSDPQTWNRYAYVRNNPLAATDPTGEQVFYCGGAGESSSPAGCSGSPPSDDGHPESSCLIDGMDAPCGIAGAILGSGAGVQCYGSIPECGNVNVDAAGNATLSIPNGSFYEYMLQNTVTGSIRDVSVQTVGNKLIQLGRVPDQDEIDMDAILGEAGVLTDSNLKSALANMVIGDLVAGGAAGAEAIGTTVQVVGEAGNYAGRLVGANIETYLGTIGRYGGVPFGVAGVRDLMLGLLSPKRPPASLGGMMGTAARYGFYDLTGLYQP